MGEGGRLPLLPGAPCSCSLTPGQPAARGCFLSCGHIPATLPGRVVSSLSQVREGRHPPNPRTQLSDLLQPGPPWPSCNSPSGSSLIPCECGKAALSPRPKGSWVMFILKATLPMAANLCHVTPMVPPPFFKVLLQTHLGCMYGT